MDLNTDWKHSSFCNSLQDSSNFTPKLINFPDFRIEYLIFWITATNKRLEEKIVFHWPCDIYYFLHTEAICSHTTTVWETHCPTGTTQEGSIFQTLFSNKEMQRSAIIVLFPAISWQTSFLLLPFNSLPQSAFFMKSLRRLLHTEPSSTLLFLLQRDNKGRRGVTESTRKVCKIFQSLLKWFLPEESFQPHFTILPVSYNTVSAK